MLLSDAAKHIQYIPGNKVMYEFPFSDSDLSYLVVDAGTGTEKVPAL